MVKLLDLQAITAQHGDEYKAAVNRVIDSGWCLQGNENKKVDLYRYVTEGTFDSYLYQMLENKQKFISQIMTSKSPVRSCQDMDEVSLSYAEIKALSAGNPLIKEKMDLDIEVGKLKMLKASHNNAHYRLQDTISTSLPFKIEHLQRL